MSDHEATAEALFDAAAILERDGWGTGSWVTDEGRHCVIGAVAIACDLDLSLPMLTIWPQAGKVPFAAHEAIKAELKARGFEMSPWIWNDNYATEQAALDVLNAAAKAELRRADDAAFATYAANVAVSS